jgi:hypothetical protein
MERRDLVRHSAEHRDSGAKFHPLLRHALLKKSADANYIMLQKVLHAGMGCIIESFKKGHDHFHDL